MPAQCDLRSVQSLRGEMLAALDAGSALTLDCAAVERADMAFLQLVLAAGRSAARRGATLALTNRTGGLDVAFRRAGLDPSAPAMPAL
ncbi:STAS domain-containing protein [Methylobacterium sp. E-005]|uniref:STAS domain-containing protein n=1 Tax=Methylobacterium sp. E-005 TaxID=2836549 RepID=UPI001FB926F0|nr:STAS domain-containing protein [Methylobacterium sp. E-005]MCJ2088599.1 STAS domain-containing protein [Methylobacterium sp. E-005]